MSGLQAREVFIQISNYVIFSSGKELSRTSIGSRVFLDPIPDPWVDIKGLSPGGVIISPRSTLGGIVSVKIVHVDVYESTGNMG